MAGLPAATQYGGTSCVTTLFAPMIAPLPIITEESMQTLFPIQTFFAATYARPHPSLGVAGQGAPSFGGCAQHRTFLIPVQSYNKIL